MRRGDYEAFYELTFQGEPLNLNESAAWIANTRTDDKERKNESFHGSTHVMIMNDYPTNQKKFHLHHIAAKADDFDRLERLKGSQRESRRNVFFSFSSPILDIADNMSISRGSKVVVFRNAMEHSNCI